MRSSVPLFCAVLAWANGVRGELIVQPPSDECLSLFSFAESFYGDPDPESVQLTEVFQGNGWPAERPENGNQCLSMCSDWDGIRCDEAGNVIQIGLLEDFWQRTFRLPLNANVSALFDVPSMRAIELSGLIITGPPPPTLPPLLEFLVLRFDSANPDAMIPAGWQSEALGDTVGLAGISGPLPDDMSAFWPKLSYLHIDDSSVTSFPSKLPLSLEVLSLQSSVNMGSLPQDMPLGSLRRVTISSGPEGFVPDEWCAGIPDGSLSYPNTMGCNDCVLYCADNSCCSEVNEVCVDYDVAPQATGLTCEVMGNVTCVGALGCSEYSTSSNGTTAEEDGTPSLIRIHNSIESLCPVHECALCVPPLQRVELGECLEGEGRVVILPGEAFESSIPGNTTFEWYFASRPCTGADIAAGLISEYGVMRFQLQSNVQKPPYYSSMSATIVSRNGIFGGSAMKRLATEPGTLQAPQVEVDVYLETSETVLSLGLNGTGVLPPLNNVTASDVFFEC